MMTFRNISIFSLLIIAILFISCNNNSDATLLKKIQSESFHMPVNVIVTVSGGHVYLEGYVSSDSISLDIENRIKNIGNVASVKNNLNIIPSL